MRRLGLPDVFALSRIIDKMNIRFDISEIVDQINNTKTDDQSDEDVVERVGAELMLNIYRNLHLAEIEIYEWLADLLEIDVTEVRSLSFKELKDVVLKIVENEDIGTFFGSFGKKEVPLNTSSSNNLEA